MQCGVAKYAEGVAVIGDERLNPMFINRNGRIAWSNSSANTASHAETPQRPCRQRKSGMDDLLNAFFSADYSAQPIEHSSFAAGIVPGVLGGMAICRHVHGDTSRIVLLPRPFVNPSVIIPMVVTVVMMVLNNNLVTAFGLMAVFAIVRFRNVLRDTLDTSYVLCRARGGHGVRHPTFLARSHRHCDARSRSCSSSVHRLAAVTATM